MANDDRLQATGSDGSADTFHFQQLEGTEADDGLRDSLWIDLDQPVEPLADDGPTCDPSANPVLMVLADQQDFYYDEY